MFTKTQCPLQSEASSLRAELGLLRASSDEAERAKQELRADNTRLTHRISYLEDQVHELLATHKQVRAAAMMIFRVVRQSCL